MGPQIVDLGHELQIDSVASEAHDLGAQFEKYRIMQSVFSPVGLQHQYVHNQSTTLRAFPLLYHLSRTFVFLGVSKDVCYQIIAFVLNKYFIYELRNFVGLQLLKVLNMREHREKKKQQKQTWSNKTQKFKVRCSQHTNCSR